MADDTTVPKQFIRMYWIMRFTMALIWVWTAVVSWFYFPHAESIALLNRVGITTFALPILVIACVLDGLMGLLSGLFATKRLWQAQAVIVVVYTVIILFKLPEYAAHPFGPIIKNMAVLACLAYLMQLEEYIAMQKRKQ